MAEAQFKSEDLERWIYDAAEYIARTTKGVVMPSRRCGHCSRPAIEHKNADTTDCQQIQLDGNDYCRSLYAEYETLKEFMETLKTGQTAESTIKAFDVKAKGAEKRVKKLERDMEQETTTFPTASYDRPIVWVINVHCVHEYECP